MNFLIELDQSAVLKSLCATRILFGFYTSVLYCITVLGLVVCNYNTSDELMGSGSPDHMFGLD